MSKRILISKANTTKYLYGILSELDKEKEKEIVALADSYIDLYDNLSYLKKSYENKLNFIIEIRRSKDFEGLSSSNRELLNFIKNIDDKYDTPISIIYRTIQFSRSTNLNKTNFTKAISEIGFDIDKIFKYEEDLNKEKESEIMNETDRLISEYKKIMGGNSL